MLEEEKKAFSGWDFSCLENRMFEEKLPWDYKKIVLFFLKSEMRLLDMGTGGGEFLLTLNHPYDKTYVTEAYVPNIELCKRKLSPLGITVKEIKEDSHLPFSDNFFDIIINRHEAYNIKEVKRILKSGGFFITQQVGGLNNNKLSNELLDNFVSAYKNFNCINEVNDFRKENMIIHKSDEYFPFLKFVDIGALVYFCKIIKWEFPDFSVNANLDKLLKINDIIEKNGFYLSQEHRFIIVAQKE